MQDYIWLHALRALARSLGEALRERSRPPASHRPAGRARTSCSRRAANTAPRAPPPAALKAPEDPDREELHPGVVPGARLVDVALERRPEGRGYQPRAHPAGITRDSRTERINQATGMPGSRDALGFRPGTIATTAIAVTTAAQRPRERHGGMVPAQSAARWPPGSVAASASALGRACDGSTPPQRMGRRRRRCCRSAKLCMCNVFEPLGVSRLAGRRFPVVPRVRARDAHAGRRAGLGDDRRLSARAATRCWITPLPVTPGLWPLSATTSYLMAGCDLAEIAANQARRVGRRVRRSAGLRSGLGRPSHAPRSATVRGLGARDMLARNPRGEDTRWQSG